MSNADLDAKVVELDRARESAEAEATGICRRCAGIAFC